MVSLPKVRYQDHSFGVFEKFASIKIMSLSGSYIFFKQWYGICGRWWSPKWFISLAKEINLNIEIMFTVCLFEMIIPPS